MYHGENILEIIDQGLQGLFTGDEVLQKIANLTGGNFYRADGTIQIEPDARPSLHGPAYDADKAAARGA